MSREPQTGTPSLYGDGDQKNYPRKALREEQRHHTKKVEGYNQKEWTSAMNNMRSEHIEDAIRDRSKTDPLFRATMNGHKPSRGAQQDAEILAEEQEILKKKKEKTDSLPGKKLEHKSEKQQGMEDQEIQEDQELQKAREEFEMQKARERLY
ncbi:hypothetical protein F5Y19DRAFT_469107 [Xylariaceae sp. FL1651]|nr:hypothetical protein F5Y19DRAFT_469107 [Xylariaceae sp. FL1651]